MDQILTFWYFIQNFTKHFYHLPSIKFQVFEEKFIKELKAILEAGKKTDINDIVDSFQPHQICTQIKIMKALEDDR